MLRVLRNLVLILLGAAVLAVGVALLTTPDPVYWVQERITRPAYWAYDDMIIEIASKRGLDPMLVKAIIWRESRFSPNKRGTSGERGLMQVGEAAATDWAKAEKIETFVPTDLFDPYNNVQAGTWYLRQALERWKKHDDPIPFALAEYNAGRTRVDRWVAETKSGDNATAAEFLAAMDFRGTRQYIEDIMERHRFYQKRGRL